MKPLLILTQGVLLSYGTRFFPIGGALDRVRFICYGLIILYGLLFSLRAKLRGPRFIDLLAGGILSFAFLSSFYSIDPDLTKERSLANLLMYVAIFWALWVASRNPREATGFIRSLIFVWLLFYMANALLLLIRPSEAFFLMGGEHLGGGEYERFTGIMSNPNGIGNFSALIFPLVIWNFRQKRNLFNIFLLGATTFSFFLSFSRNAFICSIIGSSVYLWLSLPKSRRPPLLIGAVCLIGIMILHVDFLSSLLPKALVRRESLDLLGGRIEAWEAALELIKRRPLLGYGFGVEELLFKYFGYRFEVHSGAMVHNSFLGLTIQLGWIASSLLYLAFSIFLIRSFLKILRLRQRIPQLTIALYATILSGFFTSFFESWLYAPGGILAFTFFVCVMLLMRMLEFEEMTRHGVPLGRSSVDKRLKS